MKKDSFKLIIMSVAVMSAYKGYFDYSGIDFSKLKLISETTAVEQKNNESYEVLQFLQENEYVYAIHEK